MVPHQRYRGLELDRLRFLKDVRHSGVCEDIALMLISHQEVLRLEEVVTDLLYLFQQKFVIAIWGF